MIKKSQKQTTRLTPEQLRQRLKALLIVGSLLLPTFCVIGALALTLAAHQVTWIVWLLLIGWVVVGALLGGLIMRLLQTFRALNEN